MSKQMRKKERVYIWLNRNEIHVNFIVYILISYIKDFYKKTV